jgi:hypothetical protein
MCHMIRGVHDPARARIGGEEGVSGEEEGQ